MASMNPTDLKSSRPERLPSWKIQVRIPIAAPTESRFMSTAFRGRTKDRKDTSSRTSVSPRTTAKMRGKSARRTLRKSW